MNEFDYKTYDIRSAGILTGSYVTGNDLENLKSQDKLVLLVDFTKGDLTSAEIKIEFSHNGDDWFQESAKSASSGTITESPAEHQISASGKYYIPLDIKTQYARISAKGTGTVDNSSLSIIAIVGQDL